jgi:hypothetical protein
MPAVGRVDIFHLFHPDGVRTTDLDRLRQCRSGPKRQAATRDDETLLQNSEAVGQPTPIHQDYSHIRIPDRFFLVHTQMTIS